MRLPDTSNSERHERIRKESDSRFFLSQVMHLIFIVGVAALIILYFVRPGIQNNPVYIVSGMFAVLVKIAEMIIRFLPK